VLCDITPNSLGKWIITGCCLNKTTSKLNRELKDIFAFKN